MKRLQLLTIFLMLSALSFGQFNQSFQPVEQTIFDPILQQFGGQEIFRFQPGLVTQLGAGSTDFGFNQKWFSIGELNTASQMVYGLRFQLPNKSLTMGYQDTNDTNPRIQWIGTGQNLGNLEFRVANSFTSTSSDLVATMRNDGSTVFGTDISSLSNTNVVINNSGFDKALNIINESGSIGVDVLQNNSNIINVCYNAIIPEGVSGQRNIGYDVLLNANSSENIGYSAIIQGQANIRIGARGRSLGEGIANFGISGFATGADNNYGIFGRVNNTNGVSNNSGDFAGFFDGDIATTGGFFEPSDEKLKDNVVELVSPLDNLMKLRPKTYQYIRSDKINLANGKQYGFIAQELEKVFPELTKDIKKPVFDKDNNVKEFFEYKSVNYLGLIAILTASIQELTAEVNQLKENKETYVVYEAAFTQEELAKIAQNGYRLEQNYPNPFQGRSSIAYALPEAENNASIMIFDMTGKTIKENPLKEKQGQIQIDSQDFRPGIYLYSLIGNNKEIITKRMIVK